MNVCIGIAVHAQPERFQRTLEAVRSCTRPTQLLLLGDGPDAETALALRSHSQVLQSNTDRPLGMAACLNRIFRESECELGVLLESGSVATPGWLDRIENALARSSEYALAGPSTNLCWNEQCVDHNTDEDAVLRYAATAADRFGESCQTLEPLYSLADFCYVVHRRVWERIGPADEAYGPGPCWEMDYNVRAARAGLAGIWVRGAYVHRSPFTQRRQRLEAEYFERNKQLYQRHFCGRQSHGSPAPFRSSCAGDRCPNFARSALLHRVASAPAVARSETLISCIMPTCDRPDFVRRSVALFQRQSYSHAELIVVDDGKHSIASLLPEDSRIRYMRVDRRLSLGAKRNLACEQARGALIAHWDDDDWYATDRLERQVRSFSETSADVCGSSTLHYWQPATGRAWLYRYGGPRTWLAGNTLAYRREFWLANRFPDVQVGEDARFLWQKPSARMHDLRLPGLWVGFVHDSNTSPKHVGGAWWTPEPADVVQQLMGSAFAGARGHVISCIMPTRNRRSMLATALRAFSAQTWTERELIVVDDGEDCVEALCRDNPSVRYIRLHSRITIGEKRNLACREARGAFIAHWDDDDWYSPLRLERQVEPLLEGSVDITGLEALYFFEAHTGRCWSVSPELHKRMFFADVHGGTLMFRRSILGAGVEYPSANLAEDAVFLKRAAARGRRILKLPNQGDFVYVRHDSNAWRFAPGAFLSSEGWRAVEAPKEYLQSCSLAMQK